MHRFHTKHKVFSCAKKLSFDRQPLRNLLLTTIFLLPASSVVAAEKKTVKPEEKQAVEAVVKRFVHAWNENDLDTIASLFSADGQLISPSGGVTKTRAEIKKHIAKEREKRLRDTKIKETVESVQLVQSDNALIRGKYNIDGVELALGLKKSFQGPFVLRLAKQDNRWLIAKADVSRKKPVS
jgi:uncharacterized protein (TIGR02246 family)